MGYTRNLAKIATTITYRTKILITNMGNVTTLSTQSEETVHDIHKTIQTIVDHSYGFELRLNQFKP